MVSRDSLFVCPDSVKTIETFCCVRPVLIDSVPATQIEVAEALNGFKCRYIGGWLRFSILAFFTFCSLAVFGKPR